MLDDTIIENLPELPNSLQELCCKDNKLISIPDNINYDQFRYYPTITIEGYGPIFSKVEYIKYLEFIKNKPNLLINELLSKLEENDIVNLYNLYLNLGNKPIDDVKIIDNLLFFRFDKENYLNKLLKELIECDAIKYSLIKVYKFDEKLFE